MPDYSRNIAGAVEVLKAIVEFGVPSLDCVNSTLITSTPLAASAIYNSSSQANLGANKIRGWVVTDQPGTFAIEHSRDGIAWRGVLSSVACNIGVTRFEQILYSRYYRFRYINGATAQSNFELVATQLRTGA